MAVATTHVCHGCRPALFPCSHGIPWAPIGSRGTVPRDRTVWYDIPRALHGNRETLGIPRYTVVYWDIPRAVHRSSELPRDFVESLCISRANPRDSVRYCRIPTKNKGSHLTYHEIPLGIPREFPRDSQRELTRLHDLKTCFVSI